MTLMGKNALCDHTKISNIHFDSNIEMLSSNILFLVFEIHASFELNASNMDQSPRDRNDLKLTPF